MIRILLSLIVVGVLGGLFGIGLAVAAKLLATKKDSRLAKIEAVLPGLNCGACGYAGCSSYAQALVDGKEPVTLCSPGGPEVAEKLGELLGVKVEQPAVRKVAFVHCRGDNQRAKKAFEYEGIQDCAALYTLFKGDKLCNYGCLGLGSCLRVCPVGAISYTAEGLVKVDPDLCISCEKCVEVCPTGVMQMIPEDADYVVACNSHDKGAVVRKYCSVGCLGCKLCMKKSPEGGFVVQDFLASIRYESSGDRTAAAESCPTKCIVPATRGQDPSRQSNQDDEKSNIKKGKVNKG